MPPAICKTGARQGQLTGTVVFRGREDPAEQVFQRTFRRAAVGEVTVTMIGLRGGGRAP
ncbi:hypothetical protein GCM10023335_18570 [Streptomyces siamensis]|uniref:Uncharacterized protein n=1 Tax=Streptomyces siamensis TaxID=1274986 RepID=A0ABP9IPE2_9ACTN